MSVAHENDHDNKPSSLKSAAAMLVKGGTLSSEPCKECGGVQVKYNEKVTCVNCGINSTVLAKSPTKDLQTTEQNNRADTADDKNTSKENKYESIILKRVEILIMELEDEKDIMIQRQKAELIGLYMTIIEKIRNVSTRFNS